MSADGLGQWVDAASAPEKDRAKAMLGALPPEKHGTAHPFPVADRDEYQRGLTNDQINRAVEAAPIVRLPLAGLHGIQKSVKDERVEQYIDDPHVVPNGARSPRHGGPVDLPIVFQRDGKRYVHDGHHRLTAQALLGQRDAKVRFVNLDAMGVK